MPLLTTDKGVPHVLVSEVLGLNDTKCWPVLPEPPDRLDLWVSGDDMARVQLDASGVRQLRQVLEEAEARMTTDAQDTVPAFLDTVPMDLDDKPR